MNKEASKGTNHISAQNTNHEEVKQIEETEEIVEIDHIGKKTNNAIHNQVKANKANKALALIEETVEHHEAKNGLRQDQAAQEATKAEIHQEHNAQKLKAKQDAKNSNLARTVEK